MSKSKYTAAFTAGALLFNEYKAIEPLFNEENLADALNKEAEQNALLAIKTQKARKTIIIELKRRIAQVDTDFWEFYYTLPENEQRLALFYLCLKAYYLVFDLHIEVTLPKWKVFSRTLNSNDIQMRLDEIASFDETVNGWSRLTIEKINGQYRKMLKEAGLMQNYTLSKPFNISNHFWQYFMSKNEAWFIEACFYPKNII